MSPTDLPLFLQLKAFTEYLRGGSPPLTAATEALDLLRRMFELRRLAGLEPEAC